MKTSSLRRARVLSGLLAACLSTAALTAGPVTLESKNPKAVTIEDTWSLPGILGGGLKTTDEYTEGNVFLVLPVYSTVGRDGLLSGDVIFIEPYSSWGEQGEVAASLGLGWRHLFTSQSVSAITRHDGHQAGFFEEGVFIGANIFVDMLDTQFDNQFWQLGVGIEAGTRYVEARANYYIPLSDRELAFERRSTQTFSNSSTSTSQRVTPINNPYATGNTIAQDATFTTLATTTTTTTTIEQLFRLYEEGMEGWDVEVAVLVPGLDRHMDVKLIGGYYSFDNQPFGPQTGGTGNVEGWKAGVEVRPVPAVALTATWYEDERFVGSDWLYGIRLEIPFEMGDLGDGKGFWDRVGDSFRPRRRHLAERLVEPVRRQNEAIQVGNDTETETNTSTSTKRVTRVVAQSNRHLILVDDVVFVNNDGPTGNGIQTGNDQTGTGIAEQPFATIQVGANLAQTNSNTTSRVWNVYTQGTVAGYAESVVATTGSVNFIGSGRLIPGVGGTTFGTGPAPAVTGGFRGAGINFFGITAYNITGGLGSGDADGIRLLNVPQFVIDGNTIASVSSDAIDVRSTGGIVSTGLITQNTISDSGDKAMELDSRDGSTLNINLVNNSFTGGTGNDQVDAAARHGSTFNLVATGNTFTGTSEDAFNIFVIDGATLNLTATGNQLTNVDSDAFLVEMEDGSSGTMLIAGNTINTTGDQGIDFSLIDGARLTATVIGNTIINADDDSIEITLADAATLTFDMSANSIVNPGSDGVEIELSGGSRLTANMIGNSIVNPDGDGFDIHAFDSSNLTVSILGNSISGAVDHGILLMGSNSPILPTVNFSGNFINAGLDGIHVEFHNVVLANNLLVNNNVISGASVNHGILVSLPDGADPDNNLAIILNAEFNGNSITGVSQDGIHLETFDFGLFLSTTVNNNTINGAGGRGIFAAIAAQPGTAAGELNASIFNIDEMNGNTILNVGQNAIHLESFDVGLLTVNAANNNFISEAGGDGLFVSIPEQLGLLENNLSIVRVNAFNGNIILNVGLDGIHLESSDLGLLTLAAANNNLISGAGRHGLSVIMPEQFGPGDNNLSIVTIQAFNGNSILNAGLDGIYLEGFDLGIVSLTANNNIISGSARNGIHGVTPDQAAVNPDDNLGLLTLNLTGNVITNAGEFGVRFETFDRGLISANLTGNIIDSSNFDGVSLAASGDSTISVNLTGNQITNHLGNAGINAQTFGGSSMTLNAISNTMNVANYGIFLQTNTTSELDVTLDGNNIINMAFDGIQSDANAGTILTIDGTISNTINFISGLRYNTLDPATGIFIINGVPINANADFP